MSKAGNEKPSMALVCEVLQHFFSDYKATSKTDCLPIISPLPRFIPTFL